MNTKIALYISTLLIAALLGWGAHVVLSSEPEETPASSTSSDDGSEERARLEAEIEASVTREKELAEAVAELEAQIEALKLASAEASESASNASSDEEAAAALDKLAVAFGDYAELDGVLEADWEELGRASKKMLTMLHEIMELQDRGEAPDPSLYQQIQNENGKLVKYALSIMGQIPTEAPVNGEFTHPITTANLMGAILDSDGMPLTDGQRARFEQIGTDYDLAFSSLQAEYDDSTPKLTRFVDEFELKHETKLAFEGTLTRDQLENISPSEYRNRLGSDILSPNLMTQMSLAPAQFSSANDLRSDLPETFAKRYGLSATDVEPLRVEFDRWVQDLGEYAAPRTPTQLNEMRTDESLISARAHARCVEAALQHLQLDDATRQKLMSESGWILPQVLASPPATESADNAP